MNLRDLEDGLLSYEEDKFIEFIEKKFLLIQFFNRLNLTENLFLLKMIDKNIKKSYCSKIKSNY